MENNFIFWDDSDSINKLELSLRQNNVAVGSSDTVFGLLSPTTNEGFNNLDAIKERTEKPYIVLIDSIDKLKHFVSCEPSEDIINLLKFCWPGPLTMIFRAKSELPSFLVSNDCKIALRIPQHDGLLRLLPKFDGLFSTSANLSGKKVPGFVEDIDNNILDKVEIVVLDKHNSGYSNASQPSTILDCSDGQIKVIRVGAYSIDSLERIYNSSFLY
jgi:L-threonylcarbamoyladenylate synthase